MTMKSIRWLSCLLVPVFLIACVTTVPVPTPTQGPTATAILPTATVEPVWAVVEIGLATDPSWTADPVRLDFDIQVVDETLVVTAPADLYANPIDTAGPYLQVTGDFGVAFELEVATADFAGISLYGALAQGEWWQGITRLDIGIKGGKVVVGYWNGTSPTPSTWVEFPATGVFANKRVELRLRKLGDEFIVLAGGREVGRLPDPGLFASGTVYFGLNVAPQNRLILYNLSVEDNHGSGVAVVK
jgi:hypothetical protein